jgi:transaldolase
MPRSWCALWCVLPVALAWRPLSARSARGRVPALNSDAQIDIQARISRALLAIDTIKGTKYSNKANKTSSLVHNGRSRLFLDTADEREWEKHLPTGMFFGVTTNPVLLERANVGCTLSSITALARSALEVHHCQEFMLQAWGGERDALVHTGAAIAALDLGKDRIVVKLPLTPAGVAAARILGKDGARICMTACYNREQAFVAAGLGAEYVAPYLGRMSDAGKDGVAECASMQTLIAGMGASTRVLVASLRSAHQLSALAAQGCDTFTFSPAIATQLLDEPLTTAAASDFEAAALSMGGGTWGA